MGGPVQPFLELVEFYFARKWVKKYVEYGEGMRKLFCEHMRRTSRLMKWARRRDIIGLFLTAFGREEKPFWHGAAKSPE
jgi:hypothetical protein